MRKLYEINSDIEKLLDEDGIIKVDDENVVDVETGEVFSLTERLDALAIEKEEKIESVAIYLDDLNVKTAQIDEKIKYLQGIKKSVTGQVERLHGYLLYATDNKGLETKNISVKVKKSERVVIDDETIVPEEFIKTKIETSPDKTAIKKAIKDGAEFDFAHLQTYYNVAIK